MNLTSLLQPLQRAVCALDEAILRQYTKLSVGWENRGGNRYGLALGATGTIVAFAEIQGAMEPSYSSLPQVHNLEGVLCAAIGSGLAYLTYHDLGHSIYNRFFPPAESSISEGAVKNRFNHYSEMIQKAVRLPILGLGAHSLSVCASELVQRGGGNDPSSCLALGAVCTLLASSMYLKDSKPKLLEKASLWEKLLQKVGDKFYLPVARPKPIRQD